MTIKEKFIINTLKKSIYNKSLDSITNCSINDIVIPIQLNDIVQCIDHNVNYIMSKDRSVRIYLTDIKSIYATDYGSIIYHNDWWDNLHNEIVLIDGERIKDVAYEKETDDKMIYFTKDGNFTIIDKFRTKFNYPDIYHIHIPENGEYTPENSISFKIKFKGYKWLIIEYGFISIICGEVFIKYMHMEEYMVDHKTIGSTLKCLGSISAVDFEDVCYNYDMKNMLTDFKPDEYSILNFEKEN